MQNVLNEPAPDESWLQIAPLLDAALEKLGKKDHDALVLRFFQNKNFAEVGAALGASEDAAKTRVHRALDKLRRYFSKRGVNSTTATIAETISANSVQAAPVALAKAVTAVALAKGATASGSTLTLIKGALKIMAWTNAKTAIVAGIIVLLAAGTTIITVKEIQQHKTYPWEVPQANFGIFYKMPAQVIIIPTKFKKDGDWVADSGRGTLGIAQPLSNILEAAYQKDRLQTVIETDLPTNRYDFIAKLVDPQVPHKNTPINTNWAVELQKQITKQFGITGRLEMRNADVLALRPNDAGIHGFTVSRGMPNGIAVKSILKPEQNGVRVGEEYHEQPINTFIGTLQQHLQMPVVDETGLTNDYDFSFSWIQSSGKHDFEMPDINQLKLLLPDQLGLELVATNMPVEMLVIRKAK